MATVPKRHDGCGCIWHTGESHVEASDGRTCCDDVCRTTYEQRLEQQHGVRENKETPVFVLVAEVTSDGGFQS